VTNGGARNAIYTIASTMNATKMKSRYMLVQRYICQATFGKSALGRDSPSRFLSYWAH